MEEVWVQLIATVGTIVVAIISLISNSNKNQKKTQDAIQEMTKTFDNQLVTVKQDIDDIKAKQMEVDKKIDTNHTNNLFQRINRFAADVRKGEEFDKEFWDGIIRDCKEYSDYTYTHTDYPDGICETAIKYLYGKYENLWETDGFLKG